MGKADDILDMTMCGDDLGDEEEAITHHMLPKAVTRLESKELNRVGVTFYQSGDELWAISHTEKEYDAVIKIIEAHYD